MHEEHMSYATIKIPKPLADRIDQLTKSDNKDGFRSRAEFVTSAIRELLWKQELLEEKEDRR